MSDKAYKDTKYMNFSEMFPKGCLRTIPLDLYGTKGAPGEIPITMELLRDSALKERTMPIVFQGAMFIMGFVKINPTIEEVFGCEKRENPEIVFHEWDDKVLVIFSAKGNFEEQSYYITKEEFQTFFWDGLHPNPS